MQVEMWPIDRPIPYARNARVIPQQAIDKVAGSIHEFGWQQPIVVDAQGVIIVGHTRLLAAQKLGLAEVPVHVATDLTPAQVKAYRLADNRVHEEARWDTDLLRIEMEELLDSEVDALLTGFNQDEIDALLAEVAEDEGGDEDDVADEAQPDVDADDLTPPRIVISRPGDIWRLGEHRLICADSADKEAIARLMAGNKAALLFTSPPYANQRNYTTGGIADWDALMQGVFAAAMTALRDDGQMLVNLGLVHRDNEWHPYWDGWIEWMRTQGWRRFGWYIWDQMAPVPGDWAGRLGPRHEFVFHFNRAARKPNKTVPCKWAGQETHRRADGSSTGMRDKDGTVGEWCHAGLPTQNFRIPDSVITVTRQRGPIDREREIDHPAVFPIGLPTFVMEAYSNPGEIVFEPFSGSGTTIIAAEMTGRCCFAMELNPAYVDVAVKRWEDFTGKKAVLEGAGG